MRRYFTIKDSTCLNPNASRNKFWEISVSGNDLRERAGVESMPGSVTSTEWENNDDARMRAEQLVQDKLREGYRESEPPEEKNWYSIADAVVHQQFLDSLAAVANDKSGHFHFNPPATPDAIDELEYDCGIVLPASLREFLLHHNGGFIWQPKSKRFNDELNDAKKHSPNLDDVSAKREVIWPRLSDVEDIRKSCKWSESYFWGPGVIPFCHTHNGELLCVWSVQNSDQDSPVFHSFHETAIAEWEILYPTFADLFIDFVKRGTFNSGWAPYFDDAIE